MCDGIECGSNVTIIKYLVHHTHKHNWKLDSLGLGTSKTCLVRMDAL